MRILLQARIFSLQESKENSQEYGMFPRDEKKSEIKFLLVMDERRKTPYKEKLSYYIIALKYYLI